MFKKVLNYLNSAVRSNTGVSSLSLITVAIGIMSIVILIVICICMLVEVLSSKTIVSALDGYAAIITAVAGLIVSVGLPKALNNYSENKFNRKKKKEEDDV